MCELQSLEEIEKTYPDEWVLIVNCETDEKTFSVLRGRVVAHGKRRDVYQKAKRYTGEICIRYTGKIPQDTGVMF